MVKLRPRGARGADSEALEGIAIECFVAVIDALGARVKETPLGLVRASGDIAKVRFPGERLGAMA